MHSRHPLFAFLALNAFERRNSCHKIGLREPSMVPFLAKSDLNWADLLVCALFSDSRPVSGMPMRTDFRQRLTGPVCRQSMLCWLASSVPCSGVFFDTLCNALQHCQRFGRLGFDRTVFGGRGLKSPFTSLSGGGPSLTSVRRLLLFGPQCLLPSPLHAFKRLCASACSAVTIRMPKIGKKKLQRMIQQSNNKKSMRYQCMGGK